MNGRRDGFQLWQARAERGRKKSGQGGISQFRRCGKRGAGRLEHFYDALTAGKADAVLAASLFHFNEIGIGELKEYLASKGVEVRRIPAEN